MVLRRQLPNECRGFSQRRVTDPGTLKSGTMYVAIVRILLCLWAGST